MTSLETSPRERDETNTDRQRVSYRLQTAFGNHPLVTAALQEVFNGHDVVYERLSVESAHSVPVLSNDELATFFGNIDDGIAHHLDREKAEREPSHAASIAATIGFRAIWLDHIGLARQRAKWKMRDSSRAGVDDHIQYLIGSVLPNTIAIFPGPDASKYKNYLNSAISNKLAERGKAELQDPTTATDFLDLSHNPETAGDDTDLHRIIDRETILKIVREAQLSDKQIIHLSLATGLDPRLLGVSIAPDNPILPYIETLPEGGYVKEEVVRIMGYKSLGVERVAKHRMLTKIRESIGPQG